ncbi:MAG: sulfur carrier protein ThiS [Desulfatitalea sp.]|nr:sulfur carrier protein ThiS [Desulfatitalea sp.]NNK02230.1 sulfur carrier protein ThiS [Desulfatitalea sp.]
MKVTINGDLASIAACTIGELVAQRGLDPKGLVVEHNQRIVKQEKWPDIRLQDGDHLELLSFVGGG